MQISDLVKQYHQAISSGAETLTGTKGVENLVASLRSLTKGCARKYLYANLTSRNGCKWETHSGGPISGQQNMTGRKNTRMFR